MRYIIFYFVIISTFLCSSETPFTRGVNLTGWFQSSSPQVIQFTKFTKDDLAKIKSLGCDVIRLPLNLHYMTDGAPYYTIDPLFFYFLDQVVDWAEELELHLILDNHTFDPSEATDPDIKDVLIPIWIQMTEHYKNHSNFIYYEILNEPHGISDEKWNDIQHEVIDAIREVDTKHAIIIGPAGWNSYNNLDDMGEYEDDNLIYTFHFYDPFIFTHQGASWTDPSLVPLSGVPFPYDAMQMPDCPAELEETWLEGALDDYENTGTVKHVKELIDIAVDFKNSHDVPIFCGEFGVYIPNSNNEDRVYWYNIIREYLENKGLAWTIWDYKGGFGLFEKGTDELFEYDLNTELLEALNLNIPPQKEFIIKPDTVGFGLYSDYICKNIIESGWSSNGSLNYYSENNPYIGKYCIHWTGVNQYNNIGFDFKPNRDLTVLAENNYILDFLVRGDTPGKKFDIRFVDTKTDDPDDHPWRMRYIIDEEITIWDNEWHHVQIPLKKFTEHGSWDNGWYEPQGKFSWIETDGFEIVAEHSDLQGVNFYFDNIQIIDTSQTNFNERILLPGKIKLYQNYPNPFNPCTTINFYIPRSEVVELKIFDLLGKKVEVLIDNLVPKGYQKVEWFSAKFPSGIYLCRLKTKHFTETIKLLVQK